MSQREGSAWAAGWIAFAGFMMIMLGAFHAVAGLVRDHRRPVLRHHPEVRLPVRPDDLGDGST